MVKKIESILLGSENAENLAKFYRETVGLKQKSEFEMGENGEKVFEFDLDGAGLYISDHTEVKGKNTGPERIIINFEVDDIEKEAARLDGLKVTKKQDIYHVEGYGLIATFQDPDGNFFQFVQVSSNAN